MNFSPFLMEINLADTKINYRIASQTKLALDLCEVFFTMLGNVCLI